MNEKPMAFPRFDGGNQRVVGSYTVTEDKKEVTKPIRVYTGPRKALRV